jgi:lipoprotein-releasing system permease protein
MILGVVGSILGAAIAVVIVWNINPIHEFMGRAFHITIWDPKIYYFSEIPHHVNPVSALIFMAGGVVFATLGALVPSIRAAFIDPVNALRYE